MKDGTYFAKEDSDEKQRRTGAAVTKEFSLANARMIDQILKEIHY